MGYETGMGPPAHGGGRRGREGVTWGRRGARDGEEGAGKEKDGEEAHSKHQLVITSSANISPEARHMNSPKVTCFYCEGYHMKQLKYMYIR